MHAVSNKMSNDRVDGLCYLAFRGLNDVGRSVTPVFLLMDHFLCRLSTFSEKNENLSIRSWYLRRFQMPLKGLSVEKTLATFGIIYATNHLPQNMTKIVCLRWLTFDIFNYKSLQTILNYVHQSYKIRVVFHTLYHWNEVGDPNFFISDTSNSLPERSKN